jgi:hypothetical protein
LESLVLFITKLVKFVNVDYNLHMEEKTKKNLIIAIRFFLGLAIIGAEEFVAVVVKHNSPVLPFIGMILQPPLALIFLPPLVTAIYFMASSKMRWRLDFILLAITFMCIVGFSSFTFGDM